LIKYELILKNSACNTEKRRGEDTGIEHIQEDNSYSGRHRGGREVNTPTNRKGKVHTVWRGERDKQVRTPEKVCNQTGHTTWRAPKESQVKTVIESEQVRITHILESAE
jgi:hypothetical protein